jgi:hypothetical protein
VSTRGARIYNLKVQVCSGEVVICTRINDMAHSMAPASVPARDVIAVIAKCVVQALSLLPFLIRP